MTRKYGRLLFLSTLIFLFLAGTLVGAADKDKKEKKKEPAKNNETSTNTGLISLPDGNPDLDYKMPTVEVKYVNGKPHGKALERHSDGARTEGEYNNGLKTGLWITYDPKGRKYSQESYKDGKEDGKFITWNESGYVYEADFKDGLIDGKQCSWDKNGKLISEYGYKEGKPHGRHICWHTNGNKAQEGYFNEGTGKLSIWYPSGKICIEKELKNGKPYGKEIGWYENGQKEEEQIYNEEGKRIGKFTHWYEDGKVAYEMEFDQNGQRLYYKEYDKDGKLIILNGRPDDKKKTTKINSYIEIPGYFDLRNEGKVTAVKSQQQGTWSKTCWAFGFMGALESRLMPPVVPFPEPDFSEQHLADKNHGRDVNGLTVGGNEGMALAYLTRGGGPVDETDMPYDPSHALGRQTSFPAKKWIREIQRNINEPWWTSGYKEFCQEHIFLNNHGGIAGPLYFNKSIFNSDGANYYYYGATQDSNHNVVLVGWNDTYSRYNFTPFNDHFPYQDGAMIIKNSWGTDWGEAGYFYISMDSLEYYPNIAFTDVVDPIDKQYTYQYDLLGYNWKKNFNTTNRPNEIYYANIFEAENPPGTIDKLNAVGFWLPWDEFGTCDYNYAITIFTNLIGKYDPKTKITTYDNPTDGHHSITYYGKDWGTKDGWYKYGGYYTQNIIPRIELKGGSKFSVIIQNTRKPPWNPPKSVCGIAVEKRVLPDPNDLKLSTTQNASAKLGESFLLSLPINEWIDFKTFYPNEDVNACIKAFTDGNFDHDWKLKEALDDPTLNVTSDNGYNLNWTRVFDSSKNDFARSSWINTGERCHMEATIEGPKLISFYWKVSSDPGNSLKLYIDQDPKAPISTWTVSKSIGGTVENPVVDWHQVAIHLEPGPHRLEWSYEKTVPATTTTADCGWVDGFFEDVYVDVKTPNGGESWLGGANQLITWESSNIFGSLRIQLLKDDVLVGLIAEVPANPKMYVWEVGRWQGGLVTPGPGYKIRILTEGGMSVAAHLQPVK